MIICITGEIASGKTTLSRELSKMTGYPRYSISDYLKEKAKIHGYDIITREVLQSVGKVCIDLGWNSFCTGFLTYVNWNVNQPLIIDGIRHKEFFTALKELISPDLCLLLFLDVENAIIQERLRIRGETQINHSHISEGNLEELKLLADYIIYAGKRTEASLASETLKIVTEKQND